MSQVAESVTNALGSAGASPLLKDVERLKQAYAEDGYLVFPNLVSRELLTRLHQRLAQEFETQKRSGGLFAGGGLISGHLNCFPGESARFAYDALSGTASWISSRRSFPRRRGCRMWAAISTCRTAWPSTTTPIATSSTIS